MLFSHDHGDNYAHTTHVNVVHRSAIVPRNCKIKTTQTLKKYGPPER